MNNDTAVKEIRLPETPESYWTSSTPKTPYPALQEDLNVDVAVVGGGMAGITSAFLLKKEGLKVAIIEAGRILQGTTGHTTAKITSQHGLIYHKIKKQLGKEMARQYAQANEDALNFIAGIIKEKNIDCNFERQSAYCYTQSDQYVEQISDEVKTASELGINASYAEEIPLPIDIKCAVRFDNQARFHPLKYLLPISRDITDSGSYIFENTRAVDIKEGDTVTVVTENGRKVNAKYLIIASHYPFVNMEGLYFSRLFPERSYALGIKIKEKFPGGMYITAEEPTRSLRHQNLDDNELIIVSGEHHKTGQGGNTAGHYEALRSFAVQTFEVLDIPYRWSTQDYSTPDGIPYAGHFTSKTPNIYVATGFGKWGMTNSTASAIIIKDLITKGSSPWEDVYNPSRFTPIASAPVFIKENINVAEELISGKLQPVPDSVDIKNGEAGIIEVDGKRTGAYRDDKGQLHLVDTTCTHMGCELQWNDGEKSWDCPCHGSRFTYEGHIIEGPALKPLKSPESQS
ncbi:gamma-glutamylputrescine oxidoreductase [Oxobacter pfennigii]|uniref:Gamma-glutamylputrescine oxidoreductase n=1 Tax=Oxobacter pfennigii TaxID=36849 RepID=A0A0P8WMR3_9CLOT|nr:FAD-dependent oxidoreductase [Oxobacter pfennigii]KPU43802.1 gamma-glutamylputrescine oxidoreductase [Oxobacter pfennigii]